MPKPGCPAAQSTCPSQAPSPACPLTHVSVAMGCPITESTWHLATPSSLLLSFLSLSPLHGPHWGWVGVHNEVLHLHSGRSPGSERGQTAASTHFEGYFSCGIELQKTNTVAVAAGQKVEAAVCLISSGSAHTVLCSEGYLNI